MTRCVSSQALHFLPVRGAAPLLFSPLPHRRDIGRSLSANVLPRRMSNGSSLPWDMAVPQASFNKPRSTTRHEVLKLLEAGQTPGTNFLLVDVRTEDHQVRAAPGANTLVSCGPSALTSMQGSTIAGSLNMPIQTLLQSLPTLLHICVGAKIDRVIFYCGESAPIHLWLRPVLQAKRTEAVF